MDRLPAKFYTSREGGDWFPINGVKPGRVAAVLVFADGWVFDVVLGAWREQFDADYMDAIDRHFDQPDLFTRKG